MLFLGPFLWIGVIFPTFKIVGKVPVRIHLFINFDIVGAITGAQYLITTRGMSLALELLHLCVWATAIQLFVGRDTIQNLDC